MTLGLAKVAKHTDYDVLGSVPVKIVSKKDVQTDFLDFEQLQLQPLVSHQPERKGFKDWNVTPKIQHLI